MENCTRYYFDRDILKYNIQELKSFFCRIYKLNFYIITTVNGDKFVVQDGCGEINKNDITIVTPYESVVIFKNNVISIITKPNADDEPREFIFTLIENIENRKNKIYRNI